MSGLTTNLKPIKKRYGIGVGQKFYDVKAQRVTGVNYLNSDNKSRVVSVSNINGGATATSAMMYVDDLLVCFSGAAASRRNCVSAIVPSGSTYRVDLSGMSVEQWVEMADEIL